MNTKHADSKRGVWGVFFVSTFLTVSGNVISMKKFFLLIGLVMIDEKINGRTTTNQETS